MIEQMYKKIKDYYLNRKDEINIILAIVSIIGLGTIINFFYPIYKYIEKLSLNDGLLLIILILLVYVIYQLHFIKAYTKSLIIDEYDIISDEDTLFEFSTKYSSIPKDTRAAATRIHVAWQRYDQYFEFLKNSKWIAHTYDISNDEAIYGGDYNFKRSFTFPILKHKIISADIFIAVDDSCTIILNNDKICENLIGFQALNIQKNIIEGNNEIRFQIINVSFKNRLPPNHPFWDEPHKYLYNPYGVRYRIVIKYKK